MKQFLLLLHDDIQEVAQLSPKEIEELTKAHIAWAEQLAGSGHLVAGDGLQEKAVMISGKDAVVKDGPYMESKEMIGGYYLIKAENLEQAIEIAKACPCHLWGGTTEVREIMDMEAYEQQGG